MKFVKQEWNGSLGNSWYEMMKNLKTPLKNWNLEVIGNIDHKIVILEVEVHKVDMKIEFLSCVDTLEARQGSIGVFFFVV